MAKVTPIDKKFNEAPVDQVTTFDVSPFALSYGGTRYNPDDLVGRKGLQVYSSMLRDEQVKAVVEFKASAILARGWEFKFENSMLPDEEQKRRIAVMKVIVSRMRGSFHDALEGIASGREYGFSITEKVYGKIEYDGSTYIGINQLLTRNPETFEFKTDDYGQLKEIVQKVTGRADVKLDPSRLIHYVHSPKWDRVFGRSDLRSAYRSWYAKDQLVKMELLYLDRFGGGIVIAERVDDSAPAYGSAEYTSLQNALANMASFRSVTLPKGIKADIKFPASTDQFRAAITYHDLAIAKALLVPNLLGLSHTGQTGAYSQSQTQLEAFFWTLNADASRLEECLNEQLFRDLCDQNFGDGDYPRFSFKQASVEHTKWVLTTWKELIGAKAVVPTEEDERVLRSMLEMPERTDESEPLRNPVEEERLQREADMQREIAAQGKAVEAAARETAALKAQLEKLSQASINVHVESTPAPAAAPPVAPIVQAVNDGLRAPVVPYGELRGVNLAQFNDATSRVAFAVIEQRTDAFASSAVNQIAGIIAKGVKRALGDDENLTALVDEDPTDVAALRIADTDIGKVKAQARSLLQQAWTLGQNMARNEVDRAGAKASQTFTRRETFASLLDKAGAYFDTQAFRFAGDLTDQVRKIMQQELQTGIKTGKPLPEVRTAIWDRLVSKGLTTREAARGVETDEAVNNALDALWVETETAAAAYLNTVVRTSSFEALNEARFAEFTDPALGDFVVGFAYAAVLDSSTTDLCEHLNGRQYKADSPVWNEYRPPNHFNCRSLLVPITAIDGWDGVESDPPTLEPQEGFK